MKAIVAKYLSPKQLPTTKTRKHLIYITDVNVSRENIRKQDKKSSNKSTKRKSTVYVDTETPKRSLSKIVPNVNNSQLFPLSKPTFRPSHYDHSFLDPVSSVDSQSTTDPLLHSKQMSYAHVKKFN